MDIEHVRSRFIKHFDGTTGFVYASPGRINLIGEHTDYNGGFVFPGAIDKGMIAEIKPNGTDKVNAYSIDLKDYVTFGLNEEDAPRASWARYIFGVCREMIKRGVDVKGFNTAFSGDVPLGAGMSSSAALESTYAFALNDLFGENKIDKFELAKIGQATEHNYCGVNCGIMDQFASVFGKEGSLIRLDCRSLEYQYFPFKPEGYRLVLLDSVVKHELASSAYNNRHIRDIPKGLFFPFKIFIGITNPITSRIFFFLYTMRTMCFPLFALCHGKMRAMACHRPAVMKCPHHISLALL